MRKDLNKTKCVQMHIAAVPRAVIAQHLGISQATVSTYIRESMEESRAQRLDLVEDAWDLEEERLNVMLRAVWLKATAKEGASLHHLDRAFQIVQRVTVLAEKRHALKNSPSGVLPSVPPDEAGRIAALVMEHATDDERAAIQAGDMRTFTAVVARVRSLP